MGPEVQQASRFRPAHYDDGRLPCVLRLRPSVRTLGLGRGRTSHGLMVLEGDGVRCKIIVSEQCHSEMFLGISYPLTLQSSDSAKFSPDRPKSAPRGSAVDLVGPNPTSTMSKRSWEGSIQAWRRSLRDAAEQVCEARSLQSCSDRLADGCDEAIDV